MQTQPVWCVYYICRWNAYFLFGGCEFIKKDQFCECQGCQLDDVSDEVMLDFAGFAAN